MEKTEIASLIASRPWAFEWINFQKFLFWLFFIGGIAFFLITGLIIFENVVERYVLKCVSEYTIANDRARQALVDLFMPVKYAFIFGSFFISILLFILARYCHKIIRRNHYILRLEEAVETQ